MGHTVCDDELNTICVNYILPSVDVCDGIDNDCDGTIDEDFDEDMDGITTCAGDCNDTNVYIHPHIQEVCNNIDDNCNDLIDEELSKPCWTSNPVVMNELSICQYGTSTCAAGRWRGCQNEIKPIEEICNGLDDDCDGEVDEKVTNVCGVSNLGACTFGDKICSGNEQLCVDAVYPTGEVCDGDDNDCDGVIDNGLYRPCSTDCGDGYETCSESEWVNCSAPQPMPELCDRLDNDCDGDIDEDCTCSLGDANVCRSNIVDGSGQPVWCGFGITICDINGMWGPCQFFGTEPETCNDWDDDCDNFIDGMTRACGDPTFAGIGECRLGTEECMFGRWLACEDEVSPQAEICDQLDNDCDGEVDENLNPHDKVDMMFVIDISGSMCGSISALIQGIANYVVSFVGSDHKFGIVEVPGPILNSMLTPAFVKTNPALMDVGPFQSTLGVVTCSGSGWEPTWDVAKLLLEPQDTLRIGWRRDAHPYIIIITDEYAQTWTNLTQADIAPLSQNCQIGGCQPGDRVEIYVITVPTAFSQWNDITFNESDRLIDIYPASPTRYTQFFRNIFSNVCI